MRVKMLSLVLFAGIGVSALLTSETYGGFTLLQAKGTVNLKEIGGQDLRVVSLWDEQKNNLIRADGSFTTMISNQRPQKISLADSQRKTRALAIAFPQNAENIVFDAHSTAIAVLFQDSSSFVQAKEAEEFCREAEGKESFKNLVSFFQKNLALRPLEELGKDEEYVAMLEKCSVEILGQDHQKIKKSLDGAMKELEKVL